MIAFTWMTIVRLLSLFVRVRRLGPVRWVCACGYRKKEGHAEATTMDCPYCLREITPERMR